MTTLSEGALSPCPLMGWGWGGGERKLPESSEEAGKKDAPILRDSGPRGSSYPSPFTHSSPALRA